MTKLLTFYHICKCISIMGLISHFGYNLHVTVYTHAVSWFRKFLLQKIATVTFH